MRAITINRLLAILLASLLAACSSQPAQEDTSATEQQQQPPAQPEQQAQTAPVQQSQPVQPQQNTMPVTPDNFYNNPSNYDGTTNTREIYFAFDDSTIPSAAFDTLRAHAQYLKNHPNAKVRLEGNTDERGTREYNMALGERRAQAVEKFLRLQGVPASQLSEVSYGEEKPAVDAHNEMAWAKNRRVNIDYMAGSP